jgi:hypothetical protein
LIESISTVCLERPIMIISKVAYRIILSLFMVSLLLYCVSTVYAQPIAFPHQFYGDVTIGGEAAPMGTVVSAKVNGVESGNVTTWEEGKYGWGRPGAPDYDYQANLLVQGEHIDNDDLIEFYVNGVKADQTSTFQSEAKNRLDLTAASVPTPTPTPSPTPTVTPTPTPSPTPTTTPPPVDGGGLSGGAVAGIAVGALFVGALIVWLVMRRQKGSGDSPPAP